MNGRKFLFIDYSGAKYACLALPVLRDVITSVFSKNGHKAPPKSLGHLRLREPRRQPLQTFTQKTPQPTALKPPSTARTAGRSDWAERRFRRQPFILLSFFVLEKGSKSAGNAVIPTYPAHCPHGLQHLRRKRSTFAFTPESGYTLGSAQRIAHSGSHGETGGVLGGGGITTLGAFHTVRKPCVAGCQNGVLCRFWGLVVGAPKERREPSEQRCAYARRCSEASRPRWAA